MAVEGAAIAVPLIDSIANLVAKSLVVFEAAVSPTRWRLLDTIRAYALLKLVETGEIDSTQRRHASYFRDALALLASGPGSRLSKEELTRCFREIDNVRAALNWAFSLEGDTALGVALAGRRDGFLGCGVADRRSVRVGQSQVALNAVEEARGTSQPIVLCIALAWEAGLVFLSLGNLETAERCGDELVDLADKHGLRPFYGAGFSVYAAASRRSVAIPGLGSIRFAPASPICVKRAICCFILSSRPNSPPRWARWAASMTGSPRSTEPWSSRKRLITDGLCRKS